MGRTVLTAKDVELIRKVRQGRGDEASRLELQSAGLGGEGEAPGEPTPDDYKARLLKYIPAEVVALYLTLDSVVRSKQPIDTIWSWAVFGICLIAVPTYLWRIQLVRKRKQLLISTLAFVIWVLAIGGPFAHTTWYDPMLGGLVLIVYTFFVPIIEA